MTSRRRSFAHGWRVIRDVWTAGQEGRYRDIVSRPLTDLPVAGYPLVLQVAVPRYRCTTAECGRAVFNQDLGKLAAPRASTTRRCARYVLRRLMIDCVVPVAVRRWFHAGLGRRAHVGRGTRSHTRRSTGHTATLRTASSPAGHVATSRIIHRRDNAAGAQITRRYRLA